MIAHCSKCHHEWQAVREPGNCSWCGSKGVRIANDYVEEEEGLLDKILLAIENDPDFLKQSSLDGELVCGHGIGLDLPCSLCSDEEIIE